MEAMDFYPRSPCGERLPHGNICLAILHISIHALLAESDRGNLAYVDCQQSFLSTLSLRRATCILRNCAHGFHISIHALLAESDQPAHSPRLMHREFLSTLSLRRATLHSNMSLDAYTHISIHALLAESDAPDTNTT